MKVISKTTTKYVTKNKLFISMRRLLYLSTTKLLQTNFSPSETLVFTGVIFE